ncbi:unnamed protein product [Amoebophrya sp. A25]|nr:unnamed protein product [Amoebophrya sp. A25]|eukprot:GSA25T00004523001.1
MPEGVKTSLKKNVKPTDFKGPQKARSAFMMFCDKHRSKVMADLKVDNPAPKISDSAKKLGEMWKTAKTSDEGKQLEEEAKKEKAQYDANLEAWKSSADYKEFIKADSAHKKKQAVTAATKKAKDSGMPKRPLGAYMSFAASKVGEVIADFKKKNNTEKAPSMAERTNLIKPMWEALGEAGRKAWEDKVQEEKVKYEEDLKKWNESEDGKAYAQAILDTDPKKALKAAGEPTRPQSAYFLFQASIAEEIATEFATKNNGKKPSLKDSAPLVKAKWDALSADEKKPFEEKNKAAAKKYEEDMKEFKKTDAYKKYSKMLNKRKSSTKAMKSSKKRKTDNGDEPQPEESPDGSNEHEDEESPEDSPEEESPEADGEEGEQEKEQDA